MSVSWMFGSDHFPFFSWVICSTFQPFIFQGVYLNQQKTQHPKPMGTFYRWIIPSYHRSFSFSLMAVLIRGDGFVGNRMLAPYAGEAKMVAEEGATIEQIDKACCGYIRLTTWDVYIYIENLS